MKKCTNEHFWWILNVNWMSINTKTNCMKSLIMHVSDAASQMQIQPDFIVFSVCFHPPDCWSPLPPWRVCYLWNASGVRDRTQATEYPPVGAGGSRGGEDQTLRAFGQSRLSACVWASQTRSYNPDLIHWKEAESCLIHPGIYFREAALRRMQRQKYYPNAADVKTWGLCLALHRPESLRLNIQPCSLWAGDNTPLVLAWTHYFQALSPEPESIRSTNNSGPDTPSHPSEPPFWPSILVFPLSSTPDLHIYCNL